MDTSTVLLVVVAVTAALLGAALLSLVVNHRLRAQLARTLGERDELLRSSVQGAVDSVVAVAGDRLDHSVAAGARELDLRQQAIDQQVAGMSRELGEVRTLVASLRQERSSQHGELSQALAEVARRHDALHETTAGLREALASPKARGQWGERSAEDILRHSGFVEDVNYRKQTAIAGGGIPDFTFLLPDGQHLHMDVKFPADNYVRYLEADTDTERDRCRKDFLRDVRDRVRELSSRGYTDPESTLGFTLLFLPVESIAGFIHEADATLLDQALDQHVILCSPSNLFGVLVVIRQAVEAFSVEQASDQILERLGHFGVQWGKFCEQMEKVERQLDTVRKSFDALTSTRRNQLQREIDRVDDLRSQRGLPGAGTDETPHLREVKAG